MATLSFLTRFFSGRNPEWITRLKEEILVLGVITLVLIPAEVGSLLHVTACVKPQT